MKIWDTLEKRNVHLFRASIRHLFRLLTQHVYECLANGWKFWWHIKQEKIQNEYHYNKSGSYYSSSCVFQEWTHCALHYFTSFSVYMEFSAQNSWIIQVLGIIHNRTDFNLYFRIKNMQISVYSHNTFRYWLSKNAFKYIELRLQRSSTIQSHTHTHRMLFAEVFFFHSQKYAFYFQHFSTWFPFISTPFTQMQTDTCEYSKIVKVQTSTLKYITKMCGWKNGEQILLHIYFHRRFKQIRIAAQKFAQFK